MPRYQSYPQFPDTQVTPFNPEQVNLIKIAESIIIGARSKDVAMRDTCREYLGYDVLRETPLPEGYHLCTECLTVKHHTLYYKDSRKKNGLYSCCIQCHKLLVKRSEFRQRQSLCKTA